MSEIVEGALAAVAPLAFAARPVVVRAPRVDVVALAPGTLQGAIFPSQGMDISLAGFHTEQLV
jgi:hypothetical protein